MNGNDPRRLCAARLLGSFDERGSIPLTEYFLFRLEFGHLQEWPRHAISWETGRVEWRIISWGFERGPQDKLTREDKPRCAIQRVVHRQATRLSVNSPAAAGTWAVTTPIALNNLAR
jgi:hypothetical protein